MISSQESFVAHPPPPNFLTIDQIHGLPSDAIRAGSKINVIGFVKDYQPPMRTQGTVDQSSLPSGSPTLGVSIFWPPEKMPKISGAQDAVLIRSAKVQMWSGNVSVLANYLSEFHVLASSKIPNSIPAAATLPWSSTSTSNSRPPNIGETAFVVRSYSAIKELELPTKQDFAEKSRQATNARDKFSLLKDVKAECYYNILGQVIKVYDASVGGVAVYLSDYTANSEFYKYEWTAAPKRKDISDDDIYGNKRNNSKAISDWPGPYGKLTAQIMLFDAHGQFVRENVKVGQWIFLRNVHMKYGKLGGVLEGSLYTDRLRGESTVLVDIVDPFSTSDTTPMGRRLKDAIGRKLECERKFKVQKKAILDEPAGLGNKRKRDDEPRKKNSKQRRQERRAAAEEKATGLILDKDEELESNPNIRCTHPEQPVTRLADILKPRTINIDGQDYSCSLNVCKFKANVRVVDYFPSKIENFAVGRRASEYDMLSDYSEGEDTDLDEDMRNFRSGNGFTRNIWEWRFAVQVEDAHPKGSKDRIWVMLDNNSAQYLLGLDEDATNLRQDPELLEKLKEQLFKMWGDLEELKAAQAKGEGKKPRDPLQCSDAEPSGTPMQVDDQPNPDSDSENENLPARAEKLGSTCGTTESVMLDAAVAQVSDGRTTPNNKPFLCCIEQYVIKIDEPDPTKADALGGKRWQRMFGMFETQIL